MIYDASFTVRGGVEAVARFKEGLDYSFEFKIIREKARLKFGIIGSLERIQEVENKLGNSDLDYHKVENVTAQKSDFENCRYVSLHDVSWIPDYKNIYYQDPHCIECSSCDKSIIAKGGDVVGELGFLSSNSFYRFPEKMFICDYTIKEYIEFNNFTGVTTYRFLDGKNSKEPSLKWYSLEFVTANSFMTDDSIIPNGLSITCDTCRKIGYKRNAWILKYPQEFLDSASDFFLSYEWLAPHHVPTPVLFVKKEIGFELSKLDGSIKWLPVGENGTG